MPDICVWNRCNNNCIMCTNPESFQAESVSATYTYDKVIENINRREDYYRETGDHINLTGGEPTIHPRFLEILKYIRNNFVNNRIVIASNGRRFYYDDFTREALRINNVSWEIALHGSNAQDHDAITRIPGSFDQTTRGFKNLLKYRNKSHLIEIRIILIKSNYKKLSSICSFVNDNFKEADRLVIIFNEVEGRCEDNLSFVKVDHNEARPFVEDSVSQWAHIFKDFRLYHFPLCTLNKKFWNYIWRTLREEEVFFPYSCDKCLYKKYCLGIHKQYFESSGAKEFTPIKNNIKMKVNEGNYFNPIMKIL